MRKPNTATAAADRGGRQILAMLCWITAFALLTRLAAACGSFSHLDLYWYKGWAMDAPNGLFSIYTRAREISLDYPPLYLFPLHAIGRLCQHFPNLLRYYPYEMLLFKAVPILFDAACIPLIYAVGRKRNQWAALTAALAWALCPAMFLNGAMWGQTDSILCFELLLSFWLLDSGRPIAGCVAFAAAGLTKYQALAFLPVLLLELFGKTRPIPWKKALLGLGAAALTVFAVFLPFSIGAKNPALVFDLYLGGQNKYPYYTLNACNFYALLGLNWGGFGDPATKDTQSLFGLPEGHFLAGITTAHLSTVLTLLIIGWVCYLYIKGKGKSGWAAGLLLTQGLFLWTTRMHERYQIVVLPFALMAYVTSGNRRFLHLFGSLSVIVFFNQLLVLFRDNNMEAPWLLHYETILAVVSAVNLAVFFWSARACARLLRGTDEGPKASPPDLAAAAA
ncbi:MAG: hypothetical protein LBJ11_00815 [Oscillospiraceae bacterium]|jgi:Gpi18-like mannosyltransferase|nr:hypothetical protein [Oscillospiraceae bacterium]